MLKDQVLMLEASVKEGRQGEQWDFVVCFLVLGLIVRLKMRFW